MRLKIGDVCQECDGTGCAKCKGTKVCQNCAGSGVCRTCKGTGGLWKICTGGKCRVCSGGGKCRTCKGKGSIPCPNCQGNGLASEAHPKPCYFCEGTGHMISKISHKPVLSMSGNPLPCPQCGGKGQITTFVQVTCKTCNGTGTMSCGTCNGSKLCSNCSGTGHSPNCQICDGKGRVFASCLDCRGEKDCSYCKGMKTCSRCNGTGKCLSCDNRGFKVVYEIVVGSNRLSIPPHCLITSLSNYDSEAGQQSAQPIRSLRQIGVFPIKEDQSLKLQHRSIKLTGIGQDIICILPPDQYDNVANLIFRNGAK